MKLKGSTRARMAAKHLRRDMSLPEIILWRLLRKNQLGARFRKQVAAGPYVLDFYCAPAKLAVEVDGLSHDFEARAQADERKDAWLAAQGVLALRIAACDVLENPEGVLQLINEQLTSRLPPPPPAAVPLPRSRG